MYNKEMSMILDTFAAVYALRACLLYTSDAADD